MNTEKTLFHCELCNRTVKQILRHLESDKHLLKSLCNPSQQLKDYHLKNKILSEKYEKNKKILEERIKKRNDKKTNKKTNKPKKYIIC